jgi:nicotinic acid mononucleotide adenylyltransferase
MAQPHYLNVAWMGGSYAPPTSAHVNVAVEMANKLLELTAPANYCALCIVPVSKAYNKPSVNEACVSDDNRRALIEAFVEAVRRQLFATNPRAEFCHIHLMPYELDNKNPAGEHAPVTTFDSLAMLKVLLTKANAIIPGTNYYIAQGQDNIIGIMKRTWFKSDELLDNYKFFMYPRGQVEGLEGLMMEAMMDPTSSAIKFKNDPSKIIEPLSEGKARSKIPNVTFVGNGFNDDTSSSAVRKCLRDGDIEGARGMMDPAVFAKLMEIASKEGGVLPYSSDKCEPPKKGGGRRRTKASKRRSKRRRTRR